MFKYIFLFIVSLTFIVGNQSFAQNFSEEEQLYLDSLNEEINNPNNHDTDIVGAYLALAQVLYVYNFDTLTPLCEKAKVIIENALQKNPSDQVERTLKSYLAGALSNIGYVHKNHGDITKTLEYWNQSLKIQREINDKEGLSSTLNNLGYIYKSQGDIDKALEFYQESLDLSSELNDKNGEAFSFNNIGLIYYGQGDITKALEYCNLSLNLRKEIGDKNGTSQTLNNIGVIYDNHGKKDSALIYFRESLMIRKVMGNKRGIASSLQHVGKALCELDSIDKGIELLKEGLQISTKMDDKLWMGYGADVISSQYLLINKIDSAEHYANLSMQIAKKINYPSSIKRAAILLSNIYENQNKGLKALEMHKLYILMRDSINNEETQKSTAKQQAKYEYEKQKVLDDTEHDKLIALEQEEKEKQELITYTTGVGLALVIAFLIFIFNRLRVTNKQKNIIEEQKYEVERQKEVVESAHYELEEKNQEIMDSIVYAKRIQSAILPPPKVVKQYLQESFILYKPKDVVAGDFYWMESVPGLRNTNGNIVLFAAADCTGHGVPGAMVSVVCNNALNRSVREHGLTDPGQILNKTREIVVQEFEKSDEEVKDGMDIALCSIEGSQLQYAGAHNPLWIIRNSEILETKANKQPIGKFDNPLPYTTHTFELQKGDAIYIFSDGYVDQFGGEKGKKFKTKAFRELLLSIQDKNMEEQKSIIDTSFESWRGNLEQIDDVCVIGVKFL